MTDHRARGTALDEPAQGTQTEGEKPGCASLSYVLVVDDELAVRGFLTRCLEGWGYAVKQAGSATEALQLMMSSRHR